MVIDYGSQKQLVAKAGSGFMTKVPQQNTGEGSISSSSGSGQRNIHILGGASVAQSVGI